MFGTYEIIDTEGNQIVNSEDIDFIKYILYSNRTYPLNIKLLGNPALISDAVNRYEDHLDDIIKMISKDFNKEFPNSGKIENSISNIFRHLNLYRY